MVSNGNVMSQVLKIINHIINSQRAVVVSATDRQHHHRHFGASHIHASHLSYEIHHAGFACVSRPVHCWVSLESHHNNKWCVIYYPCSCWRIRLNQHWTQSEIYDGGGVQRHGIFQLCYGLLECHAPTPLWMCYNWHVLVPLFFFDYKFVWLAVEVMPTCLIYCN